MTALSHARPASVLGGSMGECTYPTREHHHRLDCGRRTVAVYIVTPEGFPVRRFLPRCARHDGPNTRRQAAAMGAQRIPIEEWQS